MYFMILGGSILGVITALSIGLGISQIYLSKQGRSAQREANNAQLEANQSNQQNHIQLTSKNLDADYKIKRNEIFTDFSKMLSFTLFQVSLMMICTYFIFVGRYDMAMYIAQTDYAIQAFLRISKYIGLIKNHGDFKMYMEQKVEAFRNLPREHAVKSRYGDDIYNNLVLQLPSYKWPVIKKMVLYTYGALSVAGLIYTPMVSALHQLIPVLSITQWLNIAGVTWLAAIYAYRKTKVHKVDSSLISNTLQFATIYLGLAASIYLMPLVPNAYQFVLSHLSLVASYTGIILPVVIIVDKYIMPSLLFVLDYIATWLSQEIVMLIKTPTDIASGFVNKCSNITARLRRLPTKPLSQRQKDAQDPFHHKYDSPLPTCCGCKSC